MRSAVVRPVLYEHGTRSRQGIFLPQSWTSLIRSSHFQPRTIYIRPAFLEETIDDEASVWIHADKLSIQQTTIPDCFVHGAGKKSQVIETFHTESFISRHLHMVVRQVCKVYMAASVSGLMRCAVNKIMSRRASRCH